MILLKILFLRSLVTFKSLSGEESLVLVGPEAAAGFGTDDRPLGPGTLSSLDFHDATVFLASFCFPDHAFSSSLQLSFYTTQVSASLKT